MDYYIDLSKISIDSYKTKLETAYLPPSRQILKDRIHDRFDYFKKIGIRNVKELMLILKKKEKLAELANDKLFSDNYLTILLRELNSILPKPIKIKEFSKVSDEVISKLEKIGIQDTAKLFAIVKNADCRKALSDKTGINENEILLLTKLSDLSRIKWVGANFAQMLYDLDYDTVEKASQADYTELHTKINQINKEQRIYKGQIGLNDIKIFVNAAKDVPLVIEY